MKNSKKLSTFFINFEEKNLFIFRVFTISIFRSQGHQLQKKIINIHEDYFSINFVRGPFNKIQT